MIFVHVHLANTRLTFARFGGDGFTTYDRGKTVPKLSALEPLGLALSEKQIPQIIENIRSVEN